jgi:hypothetical protein
VIRDNDGDATPSIRDRVDNWVAAAIIAVSRSAIKAIR